MDPDITKALIGAGGALLGTILTAILGPIVKDMVESKKSLRKRSESGVPPEIMKTKWDAEWNFEDGTPYTKEVVTFEKWTKDSQFEGYGEVVHDGKQYKYSIVGEVSPARVVVLTYKAEKFPTEANIGTAGLMLSASATSLDGTWVGLVSVKDGSGKKRSELRSGTLSMQKIKDLAP